MTAINPPPIYNPVVDENGGATIPWILFFNSLFEGDGGEVWSPSFVNLTATGTPTITGTYYRIGQALTYFTINITPGTNTSASAGTTYVDNFPLRFSGNGFCAAVSGLLGGSLGMVDQASNRIYVPAWTSVTVPLTVVGFAEAS